MVPDERIKSGGEGGHLLQARGSINPDFPLVFSVDSHYLYRKARIG